MNGEPSDDDDKFEVRFFDSSIYQRNFGNWPYNFVSSCIVVFPDSVVEQFYAAETVALPDFAVRASHPIGPQLFRGRYETQTRRPQQPQKKSGGDGSNSPQRKRGRQCQLTVRDMWSHTGLMRMSIPVLNSIIQVISGALEYVGAIRKPIPSWHRTRDKLITFISQMSIPKSSLNTTYGTMALPIATITTMTFISAISKGEQGIVPQNYFNRGPGLMYNHFVWPPTQLSTWAHRLLHNNDARNEHLKVLGGDGFCEKLCRIAFVDQCKYVVSSKPSQGATYTGRFTKPMEAEWRSGGFDASAHNLLRTVPAIYVRSPPVKKPNNNITRVSVLDPTQKTRLQFPCKGLACDHYGCFDLTYAISVYESSPLLECPLCRIHIPYQCLRIDAWMWEVLMQLPLSYGHMLSVTPSGTPIYPVPMRSFSDFALLARFATIKQTPEPVTVVKENAPEPINVETADGPEPEVTSQNPATNAGGETTSLDSFAFDPFADLFQDPQLVHSKLYAADEVDMGAFSLSWD